MSAVAAEAGVATGTAYVHYASKDDLVLATYLEVKRELGEAATADVDPEADAEHRFHQLWLGLHCHLAADPDRARFLLQVDSSPYARDAHDLSMAADGDPIMAAASSPDLPRSSPTCRSRCSTTSVSHPPCASWPAIGTSTTSPRSRRRRVLARDHPPRLNRELGPIGRIVVREPELGPAPTELRPAGATGDRGPTCAADGGRSGPRPRSMAAAPKQISAGSRPSAVGSPPDQGRGRQVPVVLVGPRDLVEAPDVSPRPSRMRRQQ